MAKVNYQSKGRVFIYYWLPVIFWMGLIFWLSSFNKLEISPVSWKDFVLRKFAHFWEYVFLYLLIFRAAKNSSHFKALKLLFFSLFLTIFYSLSDELHQTFIVGRSGRLFDVGVDSLGAVWGAYFATEMVPKFPEKVKGWFKEFGLI